MDSAIRYTFIIPTAEFDPELPALVALRSLLGGAQALNQSQHAAPHVLTWEVIVAVGRSPSAQRNAAVAQAQGEILIFLDSDSEPASDYLRVLEESGSFDVIGGPAMLKQPAPYLQHLFHEVLAHPYVVGPTAARYRPMGKLRPTSERELILCNLAVRRAAFEAVGPLDEKLYPNEENDWLDRAATLHLRPTAHPAHPIAPQPPAPLTIVYQPALRIRRPQRGTWQEFCATMMRYGAGRTHQFLRSGRWNPAKQGLLIGLLLFGASLLVRPLTTGLVLLAIGGVAAGAIMATRQPYEDPDAPEGAPAIPSWKVALAGLSVPFFYAAGQLRGFFPSFSARRTPHAASIQLVNERGRALP
ncbi:hypothetical protein DB346_10845 [Verrucomicrobia bacterium LW23]|nr:hypothetical protein DB346_10845 [Verrucomicrobia bacterium LW23]